LILARRAEDAGAQRRQKRVQFVDVGALAGAKTQVMQADALLLEGGTGVLGRWGADADRGAPTDAVIRRLGIDDRLQPEKRQQLAVKFPRTFENSRRSGKYARRR
jgi:hypothetical protein